MKRPLVHGCIALIIGFLGGNLLLNKEQVSLFLVSLFLIGYVSIYVYLFGYIKASIIASIIVIGTLCFCFHPIHEEEGIIKVGEEVYITGSVQEISQTNFGQYMIIDHVGIEQEGHCLSLQCKLQLYSKETQQVTLFDEIKVKGKVQEPVPQMNPSDFDMIAYLKANNVLRTIEVDQWISIREVTSIFENVQRLIKERIIKLFSEHDAGVMCALLLGDDSLLDATTDSLFTQAGIGHLLCISGFHISVIMGMIFCLCRVCHFNYIKRYLFVAVGIWFYTLLIGAGLSTLRAAIMATIMIIGRCLWQEEDLLTELALAAVIILIRTPYQIFEPGFQLSFGAVSGILLSNWMIRHIEAKQKMKKWKKVLLNWLMIQLITAPIIAYHFYEIPFVSSILNFIAIPIFSLIIIFGWIALAMDLCLMPIALFVAYLIHILLNSIIYLVSCFLMLPLSTLCLGQPSYVQLVIYSLLVGIFIYFSTRPIKSQTWVVPMLVVITMIGTVNALWPRQLELAFLYVGQGDGCAIFTPSRQVIVIDGGKEGKGKVLDRYLKYRGERVIDLMVLSHSDEDHIMGLMELLDESVKVKQIIISKADQSELLEDFKRKCRIKSIKVDEVGKGDQVTLGETSISCMAPDFSIAEEDNNDNSLVCLLTYKGFKALFTGDKSIQSEPFIYKKIGKINLLKVSHHGSKTGTSEEELLNLQPDYAIISCGINNHYHHPHQEVTRLLEKTYVAYSQTDKQGAVCFVSDGYTLKMSKQREEE